MKNLRLSITIPVSFPDFRVDSDVGDFDGIKLEVGFFSAAKSMVSLFIKFDFAIIPFVDSSNCTGVSRGLPVYTDNSSNLRFSEIFVLSFVRRISYITSSRR